MTAATIASHKGFNRSRIFFIGLMGLVISVVDLIGLFRRFRQQEIAGAGTKVIMIEVNLAEFKDFARPRFM
jgi:hypothetical protein